MKSILILIMIFSSLSAFSQRQGPGHAGDPKAREKIRAAHAAYITERIRLTPSEAEKFWPVYREFHDKRSELRQQMRDERRSEKDQKELLELDLEIKQRELDLERKYTERLQTIIPAEKLIKLRQAEIDFRRLLLRQVQQRRRRG